MIPDPPQSETAPLVGGEGNPAPDPSHDGSGAAGPPAGASKCCVYPGCFSRVYRSHLCKDHHAAYSEAGNGPDPTTPVIACPDDLIPLVAQLVANDARPIFMLLWRAIGTWHLQGVLEEGVA